MNPELWRQVGVLQAKYEQDINNLDAALELAKLLRQIPEAKQTLRAFLHELSSRFTKSFKFTEFFARALQVDGEDETAQKEFDKAILLKPESITDLRKKLLILRERNQSDIGKIELDNFEANHGKSVDTLWMRGDLFITLDKLDKVREIISKLDKLPEESDRNVAIASLLVGLSKESKDHWTKAQKLLINVLLKEPTNLLAYRVLLFGSGKLDPTKETLDIIVGTAIENNITQPFIFIESLRLYLEYNIHVKSPMLFKMLKELLPLPEHPVVEIIGALCCYFNNYGLARTIIRAWLDSSDFNEAAFSTFLAQVASDLSNAAKSSIGLASTKNFDIMKPEDLAKMLEGAAVGCMQRLIAVDPKNADSYYKMGVLLLQLQDQRAYQNFLRVLELRPDHIFAQIQIARIKDIEGSDIEAYERYRKIAISPVFEPNVSVEAMIRASEIAIKYGWIEEGEDLLSKARSVLPNDPKVVTLLAKVYLKEAKIIGSDYALEQANLYFKQALSITPYNLEAAYYLGHVFYYKREYLEAIRQFLDTADKFTQGSILCYFWVSRSYYQLYKNLLFSSADFLTNAIKYAERLRPLGDQVPEALEYLSDLYMEAKRLNEAQELSERLKDKVKIKDFKSQNDSPAGEAKVLAVYAPQIVRGDQNSPPERLFSRGSVGSIEVAYIPGSGGLLITGNLGESFQNSIEVAYAFFKRYLASHGLVQDTVMDIHVDVPGWFPKYDGPSAGVAIACAMISAYTGKVIPSNLTMTGEISLHGHVMPVGGIKEKIEATLDKGIDMVFIPKENKWDFMDMLLKEFSNDENSSDDETRFICEKLPIVKSVVTVEEIVNSLNIGIDDSLLAQPDEENPEDPIHKTTEKSKKKKKGTKSNKKV